MIMRGGDVDVEGDGWPWWAPVTGWDWLGWVLLAVAVLVWVGGIATLWESTISTVRSVRREQAAMRSRGQGPGDNGWPWVRTRTVVWSIVAAPLWPMLWGANVVTAANERA